MARKRVPPQKLEPRLVKKAAAYIRVSQISQAKDDKISLEQQESKIKDYCAREGWEVSGVYSDAGKSGAFMKDRTEMKRLLRDAQTHTFDIVVTWDITRFGRSLRDTKNNIADLKSLGIHLIALDQGIDTRIENKSNNLQLNILSSIAEYEHETIRDRTQSARLELLRRREIFLGQPPYGYFWNEQTKCLEHHPEHSIIYKRIVQDYFTKSLPTITLELNQEKASRRRRDGRWHTSTVCHILRKEAHWRGVVYVEVNINGTKEVFDYPCEPLITYSDWKDVQVRLTNSNKRAGRPARAGKYFLLHRKLLCGVCGGRLGTWEAPPRKDGTRLRRYFCTWNWKPDKHLNGHPKCAFGSLQADGIEDFVFNELLKIIKGERYRSFRDSDLPEKEHKLTAKSRDLERTLAKRETALHELKDAFYEGVLPGSIYGKQVTELSNEINAIQTELNAIKSELDDIEQVQIDEEKFIQYREYFRLYCAPFFHKIRMANFEIKRRLLQGFINGDIIVPSDHDFENMKIPWHFNLPLLLELFPDLPDPDGNGGAGIVAPMRPAKWQQSKGNNRKSENSCNGVDVHPEIIC